MASPKARPVRKKRTGTEERIRQRVRAFRAAKGLTLNEVSQRAGITLDAVAKIEGGRRTPSLPTLLKLASALGVPASELFADTEPSLSPPLRMLVNVLCERSAAVQDAALHVVRSLLAAIDSRR